MKRRMQTKPFLKGCQGRHGEVFARVPSHIVLGAETVQFVCLIEMTHLKKLMHVSNDKSHTDKA